MKTITISDPTLRDGNHAVGHQLSAEQIAGYCRVADLAGVPVVEVGHGNGIGASSLLLGKARCTDEEMISVARENLPNSRLGIHLIPGFGTLSRDLGPAIDLGVDVVRIATHCTEANISQKYIDYSRERSATVFGVLMMSHLVASDELLQQAQLMQSYGAQALIIMDSAGHYMPGDVTERVAQLVGELDIAVGFHAHNNLGLAIANSLAAVEAGATIVDGSARGFGAGAGFSLVLVLFAAMRERLTVADVPGPFKGPAIGMITAGLMSLAFMGFAGLV